MAFVAINVLTVPGGNREELERRFGARAGEVERTDGFEGFELLRPVAGTDRYLVYTRWRDEASFRAWTESQAFHRGHTQHEGGGPAASDSELWTFEVAQAADPAR